MAESVPIDNIKTGKNTKHCRYFKMWVLSSHQSNKINQTIEEYFDELIINSIKYRC